MLLERQAFLDALTDLASRNEHALEQIEELSTYFALYERELIDRVNFLRERIGEMTVAIDVEAVRQIAADTLKEEEYRWEG